MISLRGESNNRSLERAIHLLLVMADAKQPMRLKDLSEITQIPKPSILRLLSVLEKYNFCKKSHNRFYLGMVFLPIAYSFLIGNELARISLPILQELVQSSNETASLFARLGSDRILLQRVNGPYPLRYTLPIGQRLPLHLGIGKVLLTAFPDDELMQLIKKVGSHKLANGKLITPKMLFNNIENIRRDGYVISRGERTIGAGSVAAPVIDSCGSTIAAVALSGNADRMNLKRLKLLSIEVMGAANAISERLGGSLQLI